MRPFTLSRAADAAEAVSMLAEGGGSAAYHAGGTTLVDLMKLGVMTPDRVVDIGRLRQQRAAIEESRNGITIGALATMAEVAAHEGVARRFPLVVSALHQAASGQLRAMATMGGNLLQRTRCPWFRDVASACNRREPGSGCPAIGGPARELAVLGRSEHCIAAYPGDLAVALAAIDAEVSVRGVGGDERRLPVSGLHRLPGATPHVETVLKPGDLVTALHLPGEGWPASVYVKLRDRASYAFALASCAAALRMKGDRIADVRLALGGLATVPWRCRDAEDALRGSTWDDDGIEDAARLCLRGAVEDGPSGFKAELGRRAVIRALKDARALSTPA